MTTRYTELVRVNFTPEQMETIKKVAESEGQTIAGLVRYCTLRHLEQVLKPWNVKL